MEVSSINQGPGRCDMEPLPSSSSSLLLDSAGPSHSTSEHGVKLFVGGISSDTEEEALRKHFEQFGLVNATVMRDRATGRGRGFGFVQFADPVSAESALRNPKPFIRGRMVEVKKAIPRARCEISPKEHQGPHQSRGTIRSFDDHINAGSSSGMTNSKKIFVGGLPDSVTQLELKNFFEKFGSVIDTVVMYDNMTQRPRGFGFITFASEDSLAMVLQKSFYELNGKIVQVKRAVPKDDVNYTNCKNNDNNHSPGVTNDTGTRGHILGLYQQMFYQPYINYEYISYNGTLPFSPYLYMVGYNSSGLNGVGYGDLLRNPGSLSSGLSGMVVPVTYHPYANGGYGTAMFVPTVAHAEDHGPEYTNKNQGSSDRGDCLKYREGSLLGI